MIYGVIILFAVAAVLGIILATAIFQDNNTPKGIVYTHGGLAAIGLVLLIIYALQNPDQFPEVSLVLFIIAALGGFYLFYNDLKKKKPGPKPVVIIHAAAAVTAFVLLLFFVLS